MTSTASFWAIVPAAGIGSRMDAGIPKQYLKIGELTILEHTLAKLAKVSGIKGIVLVLARDDLYFGELKHVPANVTTITGGCDRADSVLNGLKHLAATGNLSDWALVHDAARPCVNPAKIELLITSVLHAGRGGILAKPASDTIKVANEQDNITETLDRSKLWQAHTPQVFPVGALLEAITQSKDKGLTITDEASAMEQLGVQPLLVRDDSTNIKITEPVDLVIAKALLALETASV